MQTDCTDFLTKPLTVTHYRSDAAPYAGDTRKVVRIGAVFSSATMTISEWKEA